MTATNRPSPSKIPIRIGLFLIVLFAPFIFILGFGANKKYQMTPQKANVTVIESKGNAEVPAKSGEPMFIYEDIYTVSRNAVCKVEGVDGNEIPTTALHNQKPIVYDGGRKSNAFTAIASFIPTGERVRVYCDLTGNTSGEFLVGAKISSHSISVLMILFFAVGTVVMVMGIIISFKNVLARDKWAKDTGEKLSWQQYF